MAVALVCVTLIIKESLEFKDVPEKLKPQVKQMLSDMGISEFAE